MHKPKVLVFGLDGVAWNVLESLMKDGRLPLIKYLMKNGVWGTLKSTIPPHTAPAWASFATGKNPGKHGCYDFVLPGNDLDDLKTITSADIKSCTFYELLEKRGYRCILINLPLSYPPRINGVVITSLTTKGENCVFPPSLIEEIPELGNYKISPDQSLLGNRRITEYIDEIIEVERVRFECAKRLFKRKWDFFFLLFGGTDWLQHAIYNKIISGTETKGVELYENLEGYLKWFMDNAPQDTFIFILSDHGFRSDNRVFSINAWLRNEGYLTIKALNKKTGGKLKIPNFLLKFLKTDSLLSRVTCRIYKALAIFRHVSPHLDISLKLSETISISSEVSKFSNIQCIYVNTKDRFSNGKVTPGKEYEKVRKEIMGKLKKLKDPKTGKRVFRNVFKKEDVYFGNELGKAPDIILVSNGYWDSKNPFMVFYDKSHNHHDLDGIYIAYGPHVRENLKLKNIKIYDVAPTILHIFGLPIPQDMDGKVLLEIFQENSKYLERKVQYQKPLRIPFKKEIPLPTGDREVKERLKKLGYL